MLALPILKKSFCGCFSLEIGTLVFAILGLIESVGGIIEAIVDLAINDGSDHKKGELHFDAGVLGFSFLHLIISILLILSVKQRNWKLVIPWLVEDLLLSVIGSVLISYVIVISEAYFLFAVLIAAAGARMYFWWIVFSFHHELKLSVKTSASKTWKRMDEENVDVNNVL